MPLTLPSSSGPPQTPTSKLHTLNETLQSLRTQLALALPATTTAPVSLPLAAPLQAEGGSREIDARAKEIVDKHLAMLHDLNETRDAVESLIEKYCLMTRRREDEVREALGLEKGD